MRDYLLDLVEHTFDLGCIDLVKVVGDDKSTVVTGVAADKTVVLTGEFKSPVAEFMGTFGMPNLGKLKILLNLPEYREDAQLAITHKKDTGEPDGMSFANSAGDFTNHYRFMVTNVINDKLKELTFNEPKWHVEFEPTVSGIQRLKMQSQANAEENLLQVRTDKGDLKFYFGDHSTHAGEFVFHPGVSGEVKRAWHYPVKVMISILDLTGDKVMKISDDGAAFISVDSGLANYTYVLPAQVK